MGHRARRRSGLRLVSGRSTKEPQAGDFAKSSLNPGPLSPTDGVWSPRSLSLRFGHPHGRDGCASGHNIPTHGPQAVEQAAFHAVLADAGIEVVKTLPRCPRANFSPNG